MSAFKPQSVPQAATSHRGGNARWLSAWSVAVAGLGLVLAIILAQRAPAGSAGLHWQVAGALAVQMVVGVVVYRLARGPLMALGLSLLVLLAALNLSLFNFWFAGLGLTGSLAILLLAWVCGYLVLETSRVAGLVLAVAPFALVMLATDFFDLGAGRLISPPMQVALLALSAGLFLVAALIVLRHLGRFALRTKLILVFMLLALLPMATLGYLNARATRAALTEDATAELLNAATETARLLDDFLEDGLFAVRSEAEILGTLDYFNQGGEASAESAGRVQEVLRTFRAKDPLNIASYAVLDETGQVLFASSAAEAGRSEANQAHFREPLTTGRSYLSPVIFPRSGGDGVFYFSHPISDLGGQIVGVLRVRYRATIWQELVSTRTGILGGESFGVLFDENFMHLAHGAAPGAVYRLVEMPDPARTRALQASGRLPGEVQADDLTELAGHLAQAERQPVFEATDLATGDRVNQVAVVRLARRPWLVAFFQPQDVLFAPVQLQARNTLFLTIILLGVVVLSALGVSQLLARPIVRLTQAAVRVAEGDLTAGAEVESQDEIGVLAATFNSMTRQLRSTLVDLEAKVQERTRALELSGEVSRRLSTILDVDELVVAVVDQVKEAFDYYHVHIYLFAPDRQRLIMRGGTGEAGQILLAQHHSLPRGRGLVGRAAELNEPVLVGDVAADPNWVPNAFLPETRAEIAVPIAIGSEVLGVLDVQHNVRHGLARDDVNVLTGIASQVALALRNARSYARSQQQAEQEILINTISQKIQRTTDVAAAMQVAVRELGQALGATPTRIHLFGPETPVEAHRGPLSDAVSGERGRDDRLRVDDHGQNAGTDESRPGPENGAGAQDG